MEPIEDDEEPSKATLAQMPGASAADGPDPEGEGGDKASAVGEDQNAPAASAGGKTEAPEVEAEVETPTTETKSATRDVDTSVELGEAFEGFTSVSPPKTGKRAKQKKTKRKQTPTAAVKIRLNTAPAPSSDQAKRKAKAGIPTGLSKRPIRSAFGGRGGDLASLDMPAATLTGDDIGAAPVFGPSGAGSIGGGDLELSDGEDSDGAFGRLLGDAEKYAAEFENSLEFYSETHEEQDPVYAAFASAKAAERREAALARLDAEEAEERKKFEERTKAKAQSARAEVKAKIDGVRLHTATKQQKQKEDAQAQYQEKRQHNEARVRQGQQIVVDKQRKDFEKAQRMMQQLCSDSKYPRQDLARKWAVCQQQLSANSSRLQAELHTKAEEIRKKTDEQFALQKGKCV